MMTKRKKLIYQYFPLIEKRGKYLKNITLQQVGIFGVLAYTSFLVFNQWEFMAWSLLLGLAVVFPYLIVAIWLCVYLNRRLKLMQDEVNDALSLSAKLARRVNALERGEQWRGE